MNQQRHALKTASIKFAALSLIVAFAASDFSAHTAVAQTAGRNPNAVFVKLASGREFTGVADPRSSSERLWLRFEARSAKVLRPVDWDRVEEIAIDGTSIPVEEFREHVEDFVAGEFNIWESGPDQASGDPNQVDPWFGEMTDAERARFVLGTAPRVASISSDLSLGHWDADVDPDGLLITLYPKSDQGWLVPASGTLQVTLFASRHSKVTSHSAIRELGRWTIPVRAEDFAAGAPSYKLPFGAVHPEFDLDVANFGLANVKFTCPGSGVFEDSNASVRIREYSPVRDWLQQMGGSRFLPGESVSRPQR